MYSLAVSVVVGLVLYGLIGLAFGSAVAGIIPGLIGVGVVMFLLTRRVGKAVEAEMQGLVPLLQSRKIAEAQKQIRSMKERYGRWQFLLAGQLDAQLGMIEYMQMHWDAALPLLESGKWQNWTALVCIGAIHHRRGRKEKAYESFEAAAKASSKEVIIYGVWAVLLMKDGKRSEALSVLAQGLKAQPDSQVLKDLQAKIANKKKVQAPKMFGEAWMQFFPEEMAQQMMLRGQRGVMQAPRLGARHAPRR